MYGPLLLTMLPPDGVRGNVENSSEVFLSTAAILCLGLFLCFLLRRPTR